MNAVRNILFIMCDQLRADHLGCYGHPYPGDPDTSDALARRGVRFERAFVQSGVCGPSRMSMYTGRYVVQPRRDMESRAAVGRRDHARRISARQPAARWRLSGKTHVAAGQRGYGPPAPRRRRANRAPRWRGRLRRRLDRHDGHQSGARRRLRGVSARARATTAPIRGRTS